MTGLNYLQRLIFHIQSLYYVIPLSKAFFASHKLLVFNRRSTEIEKNMLLARRYDVEIT